MKNVLTSNQRWAQLHQKVIKYLPIKYIKINTGY